MAWEKARAEARIKGFMKQTPEGQIVVEDFLRYLAERRLEKRAALGQGFISDAKALINIPRNRAITTNAVHVYANLIDFNSVLVEAGRETEASHRRALEFLHAHYSACDSLIDEFELQRVDFHGARLHAVVLTPEGPDNEAERVRIAASFAAAFREMVEQMGRDYPEFQTEVRIGIDSGPAVAIDGGKKDEAEPLFIGSPANHAAKLADGDEPGIVLSARAHALLNRPALSETFGMPMAKSLERSFLTDEIRTTAALLPADRRLESAYNRFQDDLGERRVAASSQAAFHFHYKRPPLKDIDYGDHPPSRAIRMPLASLFADIDGFTAYIDAAISNGRIAQAVANLHVLRAEMAAVLREDFSGRKVRFVGDCIHGLIAEGNASETDPRATMRSAVLAAAGIRSSFELCRDLLPDIGSLGLAIGIDYGNTPICRLGLRGEASVRTAASRATCISEAEQRRCKGNETSLGESGFAAASATVRESFLSDRVIANLTYDMATMLLGTVNVAEPARVYAEPMRAHQPHAEPMRAHSLG